MTGCVLLASVFSFPGVGAWCVFVSLTQSLSLFLPFPLPLPHAHHGPGPLQCRGTRNDTPQSFRHIPTRPKGIGKRICVAAFRLYLNQPRQQKGKAHTPTPTPVLETGLPRLNQSGQILRQLPEHVLVHLPQHLLEAAERQRALRRQLGRGRDAAAAAAAAVAESGGGGGLWGF